MNIWASDEMAVAMVVIIAMLFCSWIICSVLDDILRELRLMREAAPLDPQQKNGGAQ